MTRWLRDHLLLVVSLLVGAWCAARSSGSVFLDLRVYQVGAEAVWHHQPLYQATLDSPRLGFTYPPFAALVFVPTLLLPWPVLVFLWSALSVYVLGRVLGRALAEVRVPSAPWVVGVVTAVALALEPVWHNLSFAQVNLFLMAAVVFDLLHLDRRRAGLLVGIAAGLKLTPLLFVVFLLIIGRRRAALTAVSSFAATLLIAVVALPADTKAFLGTALWDQTPIGNGWYAGNQSAAGAVARLVGHQAGLPGLAFAGLVTLGLLALARMLWLRGEHLFAICLVGLGTLVASPISWSHHWVWAAPLAVVLAARSVAWAIAWASVFVAAPFWLLPTADDRELTWSVWQQVVGDAYLLIALALLVGLALEALRRLTDDWDLYDSRAGRTVPATSPSVTDPAQ
jgi:alpha-1,2-mannosyltransferase